MTVTRMTHPGLASWQIALLSWIPPSRRHHRCRCAKMLAATAAAITTMTPAVTAVVWVVARPCVFVRLAQRGLQKLANNGKVGIAGYVFSRQTNLLHSIKANL